MRRGFTIRTALLRPKCLVQLQNQCDHLLATDKEKLQRSWLNALTTAWQIMLALHMEHNMEASMPLLTMNPLILFTCMVLYYVAFGVRA